MKTKFLFFIVLLCLSASSLLAQGEEANNPSEGIITVGDYCTFLNAEQAVDYRLQATGSEKATNHSDKFLGTTTIINSNNLYDERMQCGSIMRAGLPGNYCYNLISTASTDSFYSCIAGLSWNEALQYCEWRNHSASTYNLNSCAIGAAHVDPALKSSQLTFRLVGNTCYQAVGTAVAGTTGIAEMLEEVLGFAVLVEGAGGGRRNTASSHPQEELGTVNGQRVTMPVIEEEPTYYDEADRAWVAHEQVRDHWLFEEQNHALKKNAFDRAKQLLQEKESEVTERDEHFEQTCLGSVAQGLDDATQILQYIGLGFGSPAVVTQGLSLLAKRGYQGVVRIPREAAKRALEKATIAFSEAEKKSAQTRKAFLHNDAQKQEQSAQKREAAAIHQVAERLQLLPSNSPESLWHDPALQPFLALGHDQQWIEGESKKAWEKKRVFFDAQLPIQEEQGKREIASLERAYHESSQKAQEARKQVHLLQEKLEMATQWKELVEDFSREATEELRRIITNAGNHHQRDEQVKEIQTIFEHQQAVEATIKNLEQELSSAQKKKGQVEKRANKILKAYRQEERSLHQTIERAQARAEFYHQAWRNVWSKEALPNQERLAQEAFQQAESNSAKEEWEKAAKEAQKIQELYGQLLQKTQNDSPQYTEFQKKEEEWKKQQGYAASKVALFKLGEYNDLFLKMKKELAEPEEEETVTKRELEKAKYEVSQVMELVRPYSEEATKVLGAAMKTFSNFKNKTTRSGIIRGEAEAAKQAMQQIAPSWRNEIQKIAKQIEEIFALLNLQQKTQEEVPLLPGRIMQRAGSLLIPVGGSVEIRYVSEEKEKSAIIQQREKELAELTKKLNKQTAQLHQQFSKLKKERLNIEMKRQTALAEVMTKTAAQTKILQEKEAQLATEHQALKQQQGETQEAFERREAALRVQEEELAKKQQDLEESQTAAFLEIIRTFEQQTAILEEKEKQLLATEQALEKQFEELTQSTKAETEKYRLEAEEAQKQAEEAAVARIVAEAKATEAEARADQAKTQKEEAIQQKKAAEQEAQRAREQAARSDEARTAAKARAAQAETQMEEAKQQKEIAQQQAQEVREQAAESNAARIAAEIRATQAEARAAQAEAQIEAARQQKEAAQQLAQEQAAHLDAIRIAEEEKIKAAKEIAIEEEAQFKARDSFAKVKSVWSKFSTAAANFIKDHNQASLEAARTAADTAARTTSAVINVAVAPEAIAPVATAYAGDAPAAAVAAVAAIVNAHAPANEAANAAADAVAAASADRTTIEAAIVAAASASNHAAAAAAVHASTASITWKEEIQWAVAAAQKAATFAEAVVKFRTAEEEKKLQRETQSAAVSKFLEVSTASQKGEAIFANAAETKTEASWVEAAEEAKALEAAWNEVIEIHREILLKHSSELSKEEKKDITSKKKNAEAQKEDWTKKSSFAKANAARASKELSEAVELANAHWNQAEQIHNEARELKSQVERDKTEDAFRKMAAMDKRAQEAWALAAESKKTVLSSATDETSCLSINSDIKTAELRRDKYAQRSENALTWAQQAALQSKLREVTTASEEEKAIFANAVATKTEIDWSKTTKKTKAIEDAWNEVIEAHQKFLSEYETRLSAKEQRGIDSNIEHAQTQKIAWTKKNEIAKAKCAFVQVNLIWNLPWHQIETALSSAGNIARTVKIDDVADVFDHVINGVAYAKEVEAPNSKATKEALAGHVRANVNKATLAIERVAEKDMWKEEIKLAGKIIERLQDVINSVLRPNRMTPL